MEYLVHNLGVNKGMERSGYPAKVERKIIEKNRRNHMKNLYFRLNSLLPHNNSMVCFFFLYTFHAGALNFVRIDHKIFQFSFQCGY